MCPALALVSSPLKCGAVSFFRTISKHETLQRSDGVTTVLVLFQLANTHTNDFESVLTLIHNDNPNFPLPDDMLSKGLLSLNFHSNWRSIALSSLWNAQGCSRSVDERRRKIDVVEVYLLLSLVAWQSVLANPIRWVIYSVGAFKLDQRWAE